MKAISLWQPWASLMAAGIKTIETRGRLTHVRGELAICAAARKPALVETAGLRHLLWEHRANLAGRSELPDSLVNFLGRLPLGQVLAVVELHDCQPVEKIKLTHLAANHEEMQLAIAAEEFACGNYGAGRFAWLTRNCRRLKTPVPVTGRQGFFELPLAVAKQVKEQL